LGVESGKYYTVLLADTGVDRTVFIVPDDTPPPPDTGFMNLRFVNAMAKTQPLSLIRIDSANATTVIRDTLFKNVAFKEASPFVRVSVKQVHPFLRYRMIIAATGQLIGPSFTVSSTATFLNLRSGTIYAAGFGNGTTGSLVPTLFGIHINK
jgi:hypothetical protein